MEYSYAISGWWTALGMAFAASALACLIADAARLSPRDLGKRAMKSAYVNSAPLLGGGLGVGRTVQAALWLPILALAGCALAFVGALALTVFPKFCDPAVDRDLFHALNAPFYVGLATAYVSDLVLVFQYLVARRRARSVEELGGS